MAFVARRRDRAAPVSLTVPDVLLGEDNTEVNSAEYSFELKKTIVLSGLSALKPLTTILAECKVQNPDSKGYGWVSVTTQVAGGSEVGQLYQQVSNEQYEYKTATGLNVYGTAVTVRLYLRIYVPAFLCWNRGFALLGSIKQEFVYK